MLHGYKLYQIRALSLNTALTTIMQLSPQDRAALTQNRIHEAVEEAKIQAQKIVAEQAAQLEKALSGDTDFLPFLQMYASQRLWHE
jgi:hypothetical protein